MAPSALLLLGRRDLRLSNSGPPRLAWTRPRVWPDEVKRGPMLVERRGLGGGTLVPEDIRWIAAQTDSRVDRWVLRPGAIVKPNSIIMELSDPTLQQTAPRRGVPAKGRGSRLRQSEGAGRQRALMNQKSDRKRKCEAITNKQRVSSTKWTRNF